MKLFKFDLVSLYCRPEIDLDKSESYIQKKYIHSPGRKFRIAYPIDTEKPQEVAEAWMGKAIPDTEVLDVENHFTNPKVIRIDCRSSGNRVYSVMIEAEKQNILVGLREKVFEELLQSHRIEKGIIYGDFRFINDREALLVPVGGTRDLHYKKIHNTTPPKKVKASELKVHQLYRTITQIKDSVTNSSNLYLGKVYSLPLQNLKDFLSGDGNLNNLSPQKVMLFMDVVEGKGGFSSSDYIKFHELKSANNLYEYKNPPKETLKFKNHIVTQYDPLTISYAALTVGGSLNMASKKKCLEICELLYTNKDKFTTGFPAPWLYSREILRVNVTEMRSILREEISDGNIRVNDISLTW